MTPPKTSPLSCRRRAPVFVRLQESGFTLMELLVVVAIIAVLAALAVPAVSGALAKSNDAKCLHNMRQLYTGFRLYAADNDGNLPYDNINDPSNVDTLGRPKGSAWHNRVFGYIYAQPDAETLQAALGEWGNPDNLAANRRKYSAFYCPADPKPRSSKISYGINFFLKDKRITALPAAARIILLADTFDRTGGVLAPFEFRQADMEKPGSERHQGGHDHFLFADGHVESRVWPQYQTNNAIWDPSK